MPFYTPQNSDTVNQTAGRTLWVEGKDDSRFDPQVIKHLLDSHQVDLKVEPFGPSSNITSAAKAFAQKHPQYCFLIDRDHHDEEKVSNSWKHFLDSDSDFHHLLIWRKKELENYFLDPDYLLQSDYINSSKEQIIEKLEGFAKDRIYLDAARLVIAELRESLKSTEITQEALKMNDCITSERALETLLKLERLSTYPKDVEKQLAPANIEALYHAELKRMLEETTEPTFGQGDWLTRMDGKELLNQLVNNKKCFKVTPNEGRELLGKNAHTLQMAINLVRKPLELQPQDFQDFVTLLGRFKNL